MRQLLFFFILILSFTEVFSQCPAPDPVEFTSSSLPSTCASDGSISVNASGGLSPYLYEISGPVTRPAQTQSTFNALPSGSYTIIVTDNCGVTTTGNRVVGGNYINPTLSFTQTTPSCANGNDASLTVTVNEGTSPYTYQIVAPTSSVIQNNGTFSNLSSGQYTIEVTDDCNNVVTQSYTINESLFGPINFSGTVGISNNECGYSAIVNVGTSTTGTQVSYPVMYSIISGPQTFPPQSSDSFTLPSEGTYVFQVEDNCGNTATLERIIDPKITIIKTSKSCSGWDIDIQTQNLSQPIIYEVNGNGITYPPQDSSVLEGLSDGGYSVTVTDSCGRTFNSGIFLNTQTNINPELMDTYERCNFPNVDAVIRIKQVVSPVTISYLSSPTLMNDTVVNFISGLQNQHTIFDLPAGNYSIEFTDACNTIDTLDFTVDDAPLPNLSFDIDIQCNSANITNLNLDQELNNSDIFAYTIITGNDTMPFQYNTSFNNLPPGQYTIIGTHNNCLFTTIENNFWAAEEITIPEYISPSLDLLGAICTGSNTGEIIANYNNGLPNYTFEILSGPNGSFPPQSDNIFENLNIGTHQIKITDDCGNSDIEGFELTPYGANNVRYQPISCTNPELVLFADTLPFATYSWTGPNGFTSNSRIVNINPLTANDAGIYSVNVVYNDCIDTTINIDVILPESGNPSFVSTNICQNSNNQVNITGDVGGTFSFLNPPSDLATIDTATGIISNFTPSSTYTIVYTIGADECEESAEQIISVNELPTLTFSNNLNICNNGSVSVTALSNANNFTWSNGATSASININNPIAGSTYTVTVTDQNNCTNTNDSDPLVVNIFEPPLANFTIDTSSSTNGLISFTDSSSLNTSTWNWDFGDGNTSDNENPINFYQSEGSFDVILTIADSNGCKDTTTKNVEVVIDFEIPNVFTPNDDGLNEFFTIPFLGKGNYFLAIYNRWGQELFSTKTSFIKWDGRTTGGSEVPDGTYFYLIEALSETRDLKLAGYITLVR